MTDHTHPRPAAGSPVDCDVGRLEPERASAGTLTPEQRARLIASGPNAGRVKRWTGCHECAWGKVAGCWRCGSR